MNEQDRLKIVPNLDKLSRTIDNYERLKSLLKHQGLISDVMIKEIEVNN